MNHFDKITGEVACKQPRPTYLILGHISEDIVPGGARIGGSFSYSAITARNLGERAGGITSVGPNLQLPDDFHDIDVILVPSPVTTTFENIYTGGRRKQFIRAVANPIGIQDIPSTWLDADVVHLAPIDHELPTEMIKHFQHSFIGITPQGWMRRWDASGRVSKTPWARAKEVLEAADAVVLSVDDVYGGEKTIVSYAASAKILVATRGAEGADLHYRGQVHHFPAFPANEVDPTGAGDVFAAAFFIKLHHTGDPFLAMRFASCAGSFAVEKVGLKGIPTLEQVERRMQARL